MKKLRGFSTDGWYCAVTFGSDWDGDWEERYPPYMPHHFVDSDTWWWERGKDEPIGWFNVEGSVLRAHPIWEDE